MSNEKPVELTGVEREALFKAGDHHPDQCDCTAFADEVGYAPGSEICDALADTYDVVARIVAAREAAARREAEDDPAHARMYRALVERAERAEAEVAAARREALLEATEKHRVEVERLTDALTDAARVGHDNAKAYLTARRRITRVEALADCPPGDCEGHPCIWPEDIRAALAEPERDEEGR